MPDVGDFTHPSVTVYPYDGTTTAVLTVLKPDGISATPALAAPTTEPAEVDGVTVTVQRWTVAAAIQYTLPGWWIFDWDTTGMGAGSESERVFVEPAPTAGGPTWTPTRVQVAGYISNRTIPADDPTGTPLLDFTSATTPTGTQADRFILDAVAWVLNRTGDLAIVPAVSAATASRLADAGRVCAALRAAGMIELSHPDRDADVNTARDLLAQADAMRTDLANANESETGEDPGDPNAGLLPLYSFPAAPAWSDLLL